MTRYIAALLLALILASPAQAAPETYGYDPLHTQVLFSVGHMGFTESHGRFLKFKGTFDLDEQRPEDSSANITIDAASVDLGDATWNEHVRDKFLEPAKYPEISFKSTKVTRTGEKTADLTGDLTLHGVTKPVTLHVTLNKIGQHPMLQDRKDAGFTLKGTLRRSDFGINAYIPMVADEVNIIIEADGQRPAAATTNK